MITIKFLTGWNAHLLSKSQNVELTDFQSNPAQFKKIIERILYYLDMKDFFYALFQAINYPGVSPFIATHDYCIKVLHCDPSATVEMNISPIYHLGLEYPEDYRTRHGKELEQDAVIGLLERPTAGTLPPGHTSYSYGVDAGILFKDSEISHNKIMTLKIEEIREGLLALVSCENQTSSTTLTWANAGLPSKSKLDSKQSDTEVFTGDWAAS